MSEHYHSGEAVLAGKPCHCKDELEAEVERLTIKVASYETTLDRVVGERDEARARIEAALEIPKELRVEMFDPLWPSLTPDELLNEIEERLVEALTGGREK